MILCKTVETVDNILIFLKQKSWTYTRLAFRSNALQTLHQLALQQA